MPRREEMESGSGRSPLTAPLARESRGHDASRSVVTARAAGTDDLPGIKVLVDSHRHELGFVPRPALQQAIERGWLYVAESAEVLVGMIDWWARRDGVVVLYNVVVAPAARGRGAGGLLLDTMIHWARARNAVAIQLKCPLDLPANEFYRHHRFTLTDQEPGKRRPLNCWYLPLTVAGERGSHA